MKRETSEVYFMLCKIVDRSQGDWGRLHPPDPFFFKFHAVLWEKDGQNNRLVYSLLYWGTLIWETLDPPLFIFILVSIGFAESELFAQLNKFI